MEVNDTVDIEAMNCSSDVEGSQSPCSSQEEWYNATSCECQTFPVQELTLLDPAGIAFITVATLSVLLDLGVIAVFIKYRHTPIVKASNRELSFLLMAVLMISFAFPVVRLAEAAVWRCVVSTFMGPVTTCVYAIFLVKTHRVLSIFEARLPKMIHRQWILGRSLQLVGVLALTLVQVVISAVSMSFYVPAIEYNVDPDLMLTYVDCRSVDLQSIINSAYPMLLTVLCLCFAFRARRLPENYGESRHIMGTMAVCSVSFFITFGVSFLFQGTSRVIVLNINDSLVPLVQLVMLFLPKVYIILMCPERNTVQELRKMTLAHMQRQSEFSPTEAAARDADGGRQRLPSDSHVKSPQSSKSKGQSVSEGQDASQVPTENRDELSTRKDLFQTNTNGTLSSLSGRMDALNKRKRSLLDVLGENLEATNNCAKQRGKKGDSTRSLHPWLDDSADKKSSGLFVIRFHDEEKERDGAGDAGSSPYDSQLAFNLRETDGDGVGEGDMFVVSVLGKTVTLTSEDGMHGVPELLGGVYVGSKTVPGTARTQLQKHNVGPNSTTSQSKEPGPSEVAERQDQGSSDARSCGKEGSSQETNFNLSAEHILVLGGKDDGNCVASQEVQIQLSDNEMELRVPGKCKTTSIEDVSVLETITETIFQDMKTASGARRNTKRLNDSVDQESTPTSNHMCSNSSIPPESLISTDITQLIDDGRISASGNSRMSGPCLDLANAKATLASELGTFPSLPLVLRTVTTDNDGVQV